MQAKMLHILQKEKEKGNDSLSWATTTEAN